MKKTRNAYSKERFEDVFPVKLREELCVTSEDAKALKEELGCSLQAVNQYKQGQAYPKTENLIKIAQHYNCSLDYLIGLSDIKTPDASIQAICQYTGLSEKAVEMLHYLKTTGIQEEQNTTAFINRVLSDPDNAPGRKLVETTLFSWMEQYVNSDSVKAWDMQENKPIDCPGAKMSSGLTERLFNFGDLYKEYLMNRIRDLLDQYRKGEKKNG